MPSVPWEIVQFALLFAGVGFLAQLVDGALGMAYGVVSTTMLLLFGVPPAVASASVHAAEVFTTGASGLSHIAHRNVDWRAWILLAPAGMIGGALGAFVLTGLDGDVLRPFIIAYLGLLGLFICVRAYRAWPEKPIPRLLTPPLGLIGGFLDAIGGGGWGPTVTSSLVGAGSTPRYVIGTVNAAEFLVSLTISAAFVTALATGHWRPPADLLALSIAAIVGLVVGGVIAAPIAGLVVRTAPTRLLTIAVGVLIIALSLYQGWTLLG